jgi:hypothetical protein
MAGAAPVGDATAAAAFGQAVAIDGDTVIVGASGGNKDTVYVFGRSGLNWSLKQQVAGSQVAGSNDDDFGASLAISGNRFVVGRPKSSDGGDAVIYERATSASQWTEVTTHLTASDRQANEAFAASGRYACNRYQGHRSRYLQIDEPDSGRRSAGRTHWCVERSQSCQGNRQSQSDRHRGGQQ